MPPTPKGGAEGIRTPEPLTASSYGKTDLRKQRTARVSLGARARPIRLVLRVIGPQMVHKTEGCNRGECRCHPPVTDGVTVLCTGQRALVTEVTAVTAPRVTPHPVPTYRTGAERSPVAPSRLDDAGALTITGRENHCWQATPRAAQRRSQRPIPLCCSHEGRPNAHSHGVIVRRRTPQLADDHRRLTLTIRDVLGMNGLKSSPVVVVTSVTSKSSGSRSTFELQPTAITAVLKDSSGNMSIKDSVTSFGILLSRTSNIVSLTTRSPSP